MPGKAFTGINQVICDCYSEEDAEEVGASMAKAGYDSEVWDFDMLIHEFFADNELKGGV